MVAVKLFALIALVSTGYAQSSQAPTTSDPRPAPLDARDRNLYAGDNAVDRSTARKLISNICLDQKDIWTSPFRMHKSDAEWWALVGAGTAALIASDYTISKQLPNSGSSVSIGTDISRAGQVYSVYPFAAGLFGLGLASKNDHLEQTGVLGIQALVDAVIAVNVVKIVSGRERPLEGDKGGHFWKGGFGFPSGHAAEAWAIATVVASEYENHKWISVLAYSYATAVSASRVMARQHFPADAFVGSSIGFFIGRYVVRTQERHLQHSHSQHAFLLQPAVGSFIRGEYTLGVTLSWTSASTTGSGISQ
ncbi:MAG: phosphatase PAP2 family protein [Bryobacteraceae bacterium]